MTDEDLIEFGGRRYRMRVESTPTDEPLTVSITGHLEPTDSPKPKPWYLRVGDWMTTRPAAWTLPGAVLAVILPACALRSWAALVLDQIVGWWDVVLATIVLELCFTFGLVTAVLCYRLGRHFQDEEARHEHTAPSRDFHDPAS